MKKLLMATISIILGLSLCIMALASNPRAEYLKRVNITVNDRNSYGSAIVIKQIKKEIHIITCNHNFDEEVWNFDEEKMVTNPPKNYRVILPYKLLNGDAEFIVTKLIRHSIYDIVIAIIRLPDGMTSNAFDIEVAKIAEEESDVTDIIWKVGNGHMQQDYITKGIIAKYYNKLGLKFVLFTGGTTHGDSGGGIFNEYLELIAIPYAMERDMGRPVYYRGIAIPISEIKNFIEEVLTKI